MNPLRLEHGQGLAQRGPADLQPGCELTLWWEPFTDTEVGADDEFTEPFDQILVEARATQRAERGGVERHGHRLSHAKLVIPPTH